MKITAVAGIGLIARMLSVKVVEPIVTDAIHGNGLIRLKDVFMAVSIIVSYMEYLSL